MLVGDRDLNVENSILNAQCEKKLFEVHNDHSNLIYQGEIINEYYRQDQLHLSGRGVFIFKEQ